MKNSKFHQLFVTELKDIYWAENELVNTLSELEKAATSQALSMAFKKHRAQTQEHVNRLTNVFRLLEEKADGKICEAMKGLVREAREIIADTDADTMVRDAALIIAAQKIEHYEIATYGSLATLARIMEHIEVEQILEATLEEEKITDADLTDLAESYINERASQE
ncbi:ferritin-like domain-containing protein [Dyadobacter sp. NIV53]|uniref:YciE/YciF ferroxidase family protein n=1 Tax=Dyadobacter sp. NIV53 TaxID=2861765 RepID=UPI001E456289|nr:ferritin-like domain-containing protein [Dyadobacter sp. NIV53]